MRTLLDAPTRFPSPDPLPDYMPSSTASLEDWVRYYWDCDLVVVPLGPERTPIHRWAYLREDPEAYGKATATWAKSGVWSQASGVGVLVEFSPCVVLDVDLSFDEAVDHLAWNFTLTPSPEGMLGAVVRTRSGRMHVWYGLPDGVPCRSWSRDDLGKVGLDHAEIKGYGSCVPLPPTVSNGGRYGWVVPPLAFAPSVYSVFPPLPSWLTWVLEAD